MSRKAPQAAGILDKPLPRGRQEASLSAFAFLFSEMMQYSRDRSSEVPELEQKMRDLGVGVGQRVLELTCWREKNCQRELKVLQMLAFVTSTVWKTLVGKPADDTQKADTEGEYYIVDNDPLVNRFISVPEDMGQFNCAEFMSGVVKGVLDSADFPAEVSSVLQEGKTFFIIKFDAAVVRRDMAMS